MDAVKKGQREAVDLSSYLLRLPECSHKFCMLCLRQTYESFILEQFRHEDIVCPSSTCRRQLSRQEILLILDPDTIEKYFRFKDSTRVAKDRKNLMHCVKIDCDQIIDLRDKSIYCTNSKYFVNCATCGTKICKKCRQSHDPGSKCNQTVDEKDDDYRNFGNWVDQQRQSLVSNCPKCQTLTEKNGGCPMMNCQVCQYAYCWVCACGTKSNLHMFFIAPICEAWNGMVL